MERLKISFIPDLAGRPWLSSRFNRIFTFSGGSGQQIQQTTDAAGLGYFRLPEDQGAYIGKNEPELEI